MFSNSEKILLDCTFRDGGYYTDWLFNEELVRDYFNLMSLANVDVIEVGLRTPSKNKFIGPFAFCSDEFLKSLPLPSNCKIGVMINAADYIEDGKANTNLLRKMFSEKSQSPVSLVRIACHLQEVAFISPLIDELSNLGYVIGLNLMQIGNKTKSEIVNVLKLISDSKNIQVLYFADSLGNMTPKMVLETISIFKEIWNGPIGIHAHDNMGSALINSLVAFENGASWVDGTILGMGRGAGNAKTEYLMLELNRLMGNKYEPEVLFPLLSSHFQPLQREHGWGSNLMYYLSAMYNIHPTFIQEVISDPNTTPYQLMDFLSNLKKTSSTSFNQQKLSSAMKSDHKDSKGNWDVSKEIVSDEVLIIGSGESIGNHLTAIENFIKRKKLTVLSLNINKQLNQQYINYYVASHPTRLALDSGKYTKLEKPLVVPYNSLPEFTANKIKSLDYRNYGMSIKEGHFEITKTECTIPAPLALAYALAICSSAKAKVVYLAGFDGYQNGDHRNIEVESIFNNYLKNMEGELVSLTPTQYKSIKQTTVYCPLI